MIHVCPQGTVAYLIRSGDTLVSIANLFHVSVRAILEANPGLSLNDYYLNQTICIPDIGAAIPVPYQSINAFDDDLAVSRQDQGPPSTPPPAFTPSLPETAEPSMFRVDPGAISPCTFRFSYIWLMNGQEFWAFLVFTGRTSVAGWRFHRSRWVYFGVDLREIQTFICY
jgi:phage tail protein X